MEIKKPAAKLAIKGFRPMPGKVIVELLKRETERAGLIIPATAQVPANQGKVVYVFEEAELDGQEITPIVKVGDYVLFANFSGTAIERPGTEREKRGYVVLRETDILTIIDYEEPPTELPIALASELELLS